MMKRICLKRAFLIVALATASTLLDGCATPVRPIVDPAGPPPAPDQLVGTWLSVSPWWGFKLELFGDQTGALAITYVAENGAIRRYRTEHWSLKDCELSATFAPVDASNRYTLYLRGKANAVALWNVVIALADSPPVASGQVFAREGRVKQLVDLLSPAATQPKQVQAVPNETVTSIDLYTDEQINRMTLPEAQEAIANVAHARRIARTEPDREERLKRQFELLMMRIRLLNENKEP